MCKAWGNRFNVTEGSEEPEPALTPEEQYREALCSSLSVKLLEGIDSFVDSTLLAATSMRDSSRKERNMLLSTKYKLWSALLDEDEDEVNAASSSETEETNDSGGEGDETSKEPTNDIAAAAVSRHASLVAPASASAFGRNQTPQWYGKHAAVWAQQARGMNTMGGSGQDVGEHTIPGALLSPLSPSHVVCQTPR